MFLGGNTENFFIHSRLFCIIDLDPTVQTKAFLLEPKEKVEKNERKTSIFQILLNPSLVIICLSMFLHFLVSILS